MYYNLNKFGRRVKQLRSNLSLTQNELSRLSGVNSETIRRIEAGKVIARLETLEYLSLILKKDLNTLLSESRLDNYSEFQEIHNRLEDKLDNSLYDLDSDIAELESLLESTKSNYYRNMLQQFLLLTSSIVLYKKEGNPWEALDQLTEAIKIYTPNFSLDNYQSYVYSSMEIRILMNIGIIQNRINQQDKYFEILSFCMRCVDLKDRVFPKLCHNLAGAYIRRRHFGEGLRYSELGIDWCRRNRVMNGMSLMYYGKGVCEFHLGRKEYIQSIRTSVNLCDSIGQNELKAKIIRYCISVHKMKDDFEGIRAT